MRHLFFSLLFAGAVLLGMASCTESGDGPMEAWDSGVVYQGEGFYLAGELDSGRRVHAAAETLHVRLDSLWLISKCYLNSITSFEVPNQERMSLAFHIGLRSDASILCPSSPLGSDTLLAVPPNAEWADMNMILLKGAIDSIAIDRDTVPRTNSLTYAERFGSVVDSIYVRKGENEDSTFVFEFDSLWSDHQKLPRKVGKGPWLVRFLHQFKAGTNHWRLVPEKCSKPRSKCSLEADTIWPKVFVFNDTVNVPVRVRCDGDSTRLDYCANRDWLTDSTKATSLGSKLDTLYTWSTFFAEKIPKCAVLNRESLESYISADAGGSARFWRELFVPAAGESRCGIPWRQDHDTTIAEVDTVITQFIEFKGSVLEDWLLYSMDTKAPVLDSLLADSVIHTFWP